MKATATTPTAPQVSAADVARSFGKCLTLLSCVPFAVHGESFRICTACSPERMPVAQQSPQLHRPGRPRNNDGLAIPRLRRGGNVRGNDSFYQVVNAS